MDMVLDLLIVGFIYLTFFLALAFGAFALGWVFIVGLTGCDETLAINYAYAACCSMMLAILSVRYLAPAHALSQYSDNDVLPYLASELFLLAGYRAYRCRRLWWNA